MMAETLTEAETIATMTLAGKVAAYNAECPSKPISLELVEQFLAAMTS